MASRRADSRLHPDEGAWGRASLPEPESHQETGALLEDPRRYRLTVHGPEKLPRLLATRETLDVLNRKGRDSRRLSSARIHTLT